MSLLLYHTTVLNAIKIFISTKTTPNFRVQQFPTNLPLSILFLLMQIAVAWKPVVKRLGLWKTVRSLARLYDAGMGMIIFVPIAICSWFPFISTFQTRLLFNQAFSRGLEISLILAGNNQNAGV